MSEKGEIKVVSTPKGTGYVCPVCETTFTFMSYAILCSLEHEARD